MSERHDPRGREWLAGAALESALTDLGGALAFPSLPAGFANRVAARIDASRVTPIASAGWRRWLGRPAARPVRRAIVLAIALVIIVVAVAGALGLGLPGIRLFLGPAPTSIPAASAAPSGASSGSPTASPSGPPGSSLGMGRQVSPADLSSAISFAPRLPADSRVGLPDAAYVDSGRLSLVWAPRSSLPATLAPDVGLVLTEFQGRTDPGYFQKSIDSGTRVETLSVNGHQGFWIDGVPHFFFYVDGNGVDQNESRRFVGKVLIWTDGDLTLRLETSLSRDEAIAIASSIP